MINKNIQVIGTNGKGSVCTYLAHALSQNFKCGGFTSPHIKDIRERICVYFQGEITKIDFLPPIKDIYSDFALLVEHARKFFGSCDYCIYEAGLGGRLDPTTRLDHDILIITQISMDHMNYLGNTIEDIAAEKAAAIKQNQVVFCAPQQEAVEKIIKQRCSQVSARLISVDKSYLGSEVNMELARQCAAYLGVKDFDFTSVRIPARLEKIGNKLFDVCHNPSSVQLLVDHIKHFNFNEAMRDDCHRPLHNVFIAIKRDKDYIRMAGILSVLDADFFCVELDNQKMLNAEILRSVFSRLGKTAKCIALEEIDANINLNGLNIFCGSFYLISKVY